MNNRKIIIFGTTFEAKQAFDFLKEQNEITVAFFTDNDTRKYWSEYCCTLVIPLENAIQMEYEIVICSSYAKQIAIQLQSYGCKKYYRSIEEYLENNSIKRKQTDAVQKREYCAAKISCTGTGSTYYEGEFEKFYVIYDSVVELEEQEKYPLVFLSYETYKQQIEEGAYVLVLVLDEITEEHMSRIVDILTYNKRKKGKNIFVVSGMFQREYECFFPIIDIVASDQVSNYQKFSDQYQFSLQQISPIVDGIKYNPILKTNDFIWDVLCISRLHADKTPDDVRQMVNNISFGSLDSMEEIQKKFAIWEMERTGENETTVFDYFLWNYIEDSEVSVEEKISMTEFLICFVAEQWKNEIEDTIFLKALAMGKIVISNYNRYLNQHFPEIFLVHRREEVPSILNGYTKEELYELKVRGIRNVQRSCHLFAQLETIKNTLGFVVQEKRVLVVFDKLTDALKEMYLCQTYPDKGSICWNDWNEECLEEYDFIAFFHSDMVYGMYYLEDMINGFKYTDSEFVTRECYFDGEILHEGIEFDYVDTYDGMYKTVFSTKTYNQKKCFMEQGKGKGYSIGHTEFSRGVVSKRGPIYPMKSNYPISVIIPVFNNGEVLQNRAVRSLVKCSMFSELEIILVDDGSTDGKTISIVKQLETTYDNIRAFFLSKGGNGSPSRARNKGYEAAAGKYVIALDPDDETSYNGYELLYQEIEKSKSDAVFGNIDWIDSNQKIERHEYYRSFLYRNKGIAFSNCPADFIKESDFEWIGYCNFLIRKDAVFSEKRKILQKEGIIGEDYLFINELFLSCRKVKAVNVIVYYYYCKNEDSLTNTVNSSYFYKKRRFVEETYKLLKKYQVETARYEKVYQKKYIEWFLKPMQLVEEGKDKKICEEETRQAYRIFKEWFGYDFTFSPLELAFAF